MMGNHNTPNAHERIDRLSAARDMPCSLSRQEPEYVTYSEYNAVNIFHPINSTSKELEFQLSIPPYQRIYVWGHEQVRTLLDDIYNIKDIQKYFIGSIILHKFKKDNQNICDIVDGQQRIVTIALIWYVLNKLNKDLPEGVKEFLGCQFASLEAQAHINSNVNYIRTYLNNPQKANLVSQNLSKIHFGVLIIEKADKLDLAFTFFSNTNSKGKKLTDYDLLKPHHLRYIPSDLEDQQMHLASKWDEMIRNGRNTSKEWEYVPYNRLMDIILYRLRKWSQVDPADVSQDHYLKKEFEAAPIINEIPPFGEQFHFEEPIQGGQHFFAYVDHFVDEYHKFGIDYPTFVIENKERKKETKIEVKGLKSLLYTCFGTNGSSSWYGTVIEALVFCYYLKFGNNYIYEATMSIVRYISIIRFRLGRAYKPTISEWARTSKIVLNIHRATSPTFFLAAIEKQIDSALSDTSAAVESANEGVRKIYLSMCEKITKALMKKSIVQYYKNYYYDKYETLGYNTSKNQL